MSLRGLSHPLNLGELYWHGTRRFPRELRGSEALPLLSSGQRTKTKPQLTRRGQRVPR